MATKSGIGTTVKCGVEGRMKDTAYTVDTATRRTWAEIDLDALAHNLRALRTVLSPSCRIMAVVKADAYGHGLVPASRAALDAGVQWLGVATLDEGLALRNAGIASPVLVLGPLDADSLDEALTHRLSMTIVSPEMVDVLTARRDSPARVHVKVDTGMTRLGIRPEDAPAVLSRLDALRVTVEGCYTHLACADDADPAVTDEQLRKFQPVVDETRRRFPNVIIHAANSAAVLVHPRSHFDMVRVGLAMYGLYPGPHMQDRAGLKPVMQCKSRVVRTMRVGPGAAVSYGATYRVSKPTVIATVACGYADGYPRLAGNRGQVVIRGRRFPVAGRVSMDYLMVDAKDEPVAIGDEVILFGQDVGADEVAEWAQTISYEVLCGVGPRVPRIYLQDGRPVPAGVPEA